jgi:acyl-CoA thioester hydrolase
MTSAPSDYPTAGRFEGKAHILPLRVYFEDTDFSGLVYHANYLRWFERARSDMLRVAGIDQKTTYDAGEGVYAVAELTIKYRTPACYDNALTIVSTVQQVRAASVLIHQRVMRDGQLLAEADVIAAFLAPSGRPKRQPAAWIAAFEQLVGE